VNLKTRNHCPLGVYVMPSNNNLYGYFRSGTFRFQLNIPKDYPNHPPSVTFFKDVFHPLVDDHGNVCILQQFPKWQPCQNYIFHILHYLKNMFKTVVLDGLNEKYCLNKESYRLYRTDKPIFHKLAQQCAQLSITESFLFEHVPDDNPIRFSPLSESKFGTGVFCKKEKRILTFIYGR
ncbi:ubiquitin-conjugating enzyme/RWD-like protein, partial [Sporodiniella umbellata]